jgi:outer membrane protein assembly factor BamB
MPVFPPSGFLAAVRHGEESSRSMKHSLAAILIPAAAAVPAAALVVVWAGIGPGVKLEPRLPGLDGAPAAAVAKAAERPVPGEPVRGDGRPSKIAAAWPWFRGLDRDAINKEELRLARKWPAAGPRRLWTVTLGQGYAAAAVSGGCVYVLDYDAGRSADTLRCLSLDDGREIWRNGYPIIVTPHHGMSRTIPAVIGDYVVTLGPQCQAAGWDAHSGKALWLIDLVLDQQATVPPWYAGQCPLVDTQTDRLILAPGGKSLLMAVDYRSGHVLWESPNPRGWTMTHVSVVPMEFAGRRMYVYCGKGGVAGVAADNGQLLWDTPDWQIGTATCPSPVVIGPDKIFLSGGYNSGALVLQLKAEQGRIVPETVARLSPKQFGSEQQTPILWQGHLYGVRQRDQQLVCMDPEGKELWNSGRDKFGSGPYLIADGLIYVLNDDGLLTLAEATPAIYKRLAQAQVIEGGVTSWGPMALVAGRLIVRDFTRLVCLDVAEGK